MDDIILYPFFFNSYALLFQQHGFKITDFSLSNEGKEYSACTFVLNHHNILFRIAKITPTKTGQFVTLWKRAADGSTAPFDTTDAIDFVIVGVHKNAQRGLFIFPKSALLNQGVFSQHANKGKCAIRLYAPWDNADNKQAKKTQEWQSHYFVELQPHENSVLMQQLLT